MAGNVYFWESAPVRTSRRGEFWVPGERVTVEGKTYQRGPMFVAWEAPERVTQPYPIVLVHGGALQGNRMARYARWASGLGAALCRSRICDFCD